MKLHYLQKIEGETIEIMILYDIYDVGWVGKGRHKGDLRDLILAGLKYSACIHSCISNERMAIMYQSVSRKYRHRVGRDGWVQEGWVYVE